MESSMACPVCRGRLSVDCRTVGDGSIQAWGHCGCGFRIGAGKAASPWPFDIEAAVQRALEREGMLWRRRPNSPGDGPPATRP